MKRSWSEFWGEDRSREFFEHVLSRMQPGRLTKPRWNTINKNSSIMGDLKEQVLFIWSSSPRHGMSRTGLPGLKVGLIIPVGSWQKAVSPCDLCSVLSSGHQQKNLLVILSCEA